MTILGSLALRRTHSAASMPRMRPFLHPFLLVLLVGGGILLIAHWQLVHRPGTPIAETIGRPTRLPDPVLLFRQSLGTKRSPLDAFVARKTASHRALCRAPGISFRWTLVIPEGGSGGCVEQVGKMVEQIKAVQFFECRVDLHFVLPLDVDRSCGAFIDQLHWPHGKVYSFAAAEMPLRDLVVPSWSAESDREFNILLDEGALIGETSISPRIFEQVLRVLQGYFVDGEGQRMPSSAARRVAGVGLAMVSGEGGLGDILESIGSALVQRPSEVALFLPWFWREFSSFADWKRQGLLQSRLQLRNVTAPVGESWYLNEYMRIYGFTLLFTRTPRLRVEKHGSKRSLPSILFVPLKDLPVYDSSLQQVPMLELLEERAAADEQDRYLGGSSSPLHCILDALSDPLPKYTGPIDRKRPMYLAYEPHGSWQDQIDTLQKAHVLTAQLNRTLIVPPFVNPSNVSETASMRRFFSWEARWVRQVSHRSFPFEHFSIPRHVLFRTRAVRYDLMYGLATPITDARQVKAGVQVMIPALWASDAELVETLGGCREDQILFLKNFNSVVQVLYDPVALDNLQKLRTQWTLSMPLQKLLNHTQSTWPRPLICTIYSRGTGKVPCGMDIVKDKENGLAYYRNCQAEPTKVIDYAVEAGRALNMTAGSVYLLREMPVKQTLPKTTAAGVRVLTSTDLVQQVVDHPSLGIPSGMAVHVAEMLERELCQEAALFVNNLYSPLGASIAAYRRTERRPIRFLGQTDRTPK